MGATTIPTMTTQGLKDYINFMGKYGMPKHNLLLLGKHGIGKSEIAKSIFANHEDFKDYPFHTLYLSQMADPGDLTGLPKINPETGLMEFVPPFWWNSEVPIILLVDEILRARLELIQPFFSLALEKSIAGRSLHPDSVIISCANFGDEYQQLDADPAFGSRFCPYEFLPTVEEWTGYASEVKVDGRIINFIRENRSMLDSMSHSTEEEDREFFERVPDRRAWFRVDDIMKRHGKGKINGGSVVQNAIAGEIGMTATVDFIRFVNTHSGLTPEQLVMAEDFEDITMELTALPFQDLTHMADRVIDYIKGNDAIQIDKHKPTMNLVVQNVMSFLGWCEESQNEEISESFYLVVKKKRKRLASYSVNKIS